MSKTMILTTGALLVLLPIAAHCAEPEGGRARVAFALRSMVDTLDSCSECGCRVQGEAAPRRKGRWWFSFGLAGADSQGQGWEALGSPAYCGTGTFDAVAEDFRRTVGIPYVVLDVAATASPVPEGGYELKSRVQIRRLAGFDPEGSPDYALSREDRSVGLTDTREMILPLLIPDERERASFGVDEVLLRVEADVMASPTDTRYGGLSVTADVPGAEIRLDGGLVGRVGEGTPTLVGNVPAGPREVMVRDFAGRETSRRVVVEPDRSADVTLDLLHLPASEPPPALYPIGANHQGFEEYWRSMDGALVVKIPGGEFLMGSPEGQGDSNEHPAHQVKVSEFLIDKTEVTWRQYRKFAAAEGRALPDAPPWGMPDDYAASSILWDEAQAYCGWVGGRLPTEAEWEKAARGTDGRIYPWGNEWDGSRCNSIDGGPHRPESVGSFPGCISPDGVLDMPGSVWEWCADWYGEDYYVGSPAADPKGPASGNRRVLRGGNWMSHYPWLRAA